MTSQICEITHGPNLWQLKLGLFDLPVDTDPQRRIQGRVMTFSITCPRNGIHGGVFCNVHSVRLLNRQTEQWEITGETNSPALNKSFTAIYSSQSRKGKMCFSDQHFLLTLEAYRAGEGGDEKRAPFQSENVFIGSLLAIEMLFSDSKAWQKRVEDFRRSNQTGTRVDVVLVYKEIDAKGMIDPTVYHASVAPPCSAPVVQIT
jgi:hypothetical protein